MPVVACSVLVVSVLIAGKVVGISVKVNPASVSVRCDHKRMSVRITIDGSCLICVGKLFICESCRVGNCCRAGITGAVIAFGSVAAAACASCCICGCTAVCSCRRSICCCAAVCCICVCIRRSCVCIVGCRSGSCCLRRSSASAPGRSACTAAARSCSSEKINRYEAKTAPDRNWPGAVKLLEPARKCKADRAAGELEGARPASNPILLSVC